MTSRLALYYGNQSTEKQDVALVEIAQLTGGWASDVYSFTLRHREADLIYLEALVLKTFAPTDSGQEHAAREWKALAQLGSVGYPVPRVKLLERDRHYLGHPFIVMEHFPGRTLWEVREHGDP